MASRTDCQRVGAAEDSAPVCMRKVCPVVVLMTSLDAGRYLFSGCCQEEKILKTQQNYGSPRSSVAEPDVPAYQFTRMANCMTRGSPESEVMDAALPLLTFPLGWPNKAWLATLNTSHRASAFQFSWMGMFLISAASNTCVFGPS